MRIIQVEERDKRGYMDLLLLADEQENMIEKYLYRGEMFALYDDDLRAIAVVTDEARPTADDARALARVRTRHEVMVVQVVDADPFAASLTDAVAGSLAGASSARTRGRAVREVDGARVRDIETGRTLPAYLRGRRRLGEAIAQARVERHEATTARLRSLGVEHVVVEGTDDTVDEVVALLARMRRAGR